MKPINHQTATFVTVCILCGSGLAFAADKTEHVAPGYLSSGFGIPVKNNFGECWMSGPVPNFKPSSDCMTHAEPVVKEEAPAASEVPAPVTENRVAEQPKQAKPDPVPVPLMHISIAADTLFDFDKFNLRPAGIQAINEALSKTKMQGGSLNVERIIVVGHTDSVGSISYNQKLSERRANSVKNFMVSKGVDANMIVTEGRGKLDPIATNKTAAGRQLNRRVDITFEGTE